MSEHHWCANVWKGRLSQREASDRLGIGVRQVKRLVRAWRTHGDAAWSRASAGGRRTGA